MSPGPQPHAVLTHAYSSLSSGLKGSKGPEESSLNRKQSIFHYLSASSQTRQREKHHSALWEQPAVRCPGTRDAAPLNRKLSRGPAGEQQVTVAGWGLLAAQRGERWQGWSRARCQLLYPPLCCKAPAVVLSPSPPTFLPGCLQKKTYCVLVVRPAGERAGPLTFQQESCAFKIPLDSLPGHSAASTLRMS